ncbi:MAG TPA: hypothetical protein VD931_11650, partial [Baekduia sp.]|nr:hypothetical protein [Baekduia sp.]
MTRALAALLFAFALAATAAPASGATPRVPEPVTLSGGWEHLPDPQDVGKQTGLPSGAAGEGWRPVTVPHLFDPKPTESTFWGTVGWYRLRFEAPPSVAGFDWVLRFEQIRRKAEVWLDGRPLGEHRDPYLPFELPAGELAPGRHTLVLRVDNRKAKEPREGWWNWGGIVKPVRLVARGAVVADQPGIMPRRTCAAGRCRWTVLVDADLTNRSRTRTVRPAVTVRLQAPDDGARTTHTERARPLAPGERARLRFEVPVQGEPRVWEPGDPQLYDAEIAVQAGAQVAQVERRRIGLRTVEVRDGLLRLNGRPVELRGASIQEDVPGHGAAL